MKRLLSQIMEDLSLHSKSPLYFLLTFFFNMSFRLVLNYRIGSYLSRRRNLIFNVIILYLKRRQLSIFNCDISYHADIGRRIRFPHPIGIVIGEQCIVKEDVSIWQHVTLGSHGRTNKKEYPSIDSNVKLFTNSIVLGKVYVGKNSIVGAQSLVVKDVPESHLAVGSPAINKPIK